MVLSSRSSIYLRGVCRASLGASVLDSLRSVSVTKRSYARTTCKGASPASLSSCSQYVSPQTAPSCLASGPAPQSPRAERRANNTACRRSSNGARRTAPAPFCALRLLARRFNTYWRRRHQGLQVARPHLSHVQLQLNARREIRLENGAITAMTDSIDASAHQASTTTDTSESHVAAYDGTNHAAPFDLFAFPGRSISRAPPVRCKPSLPIRVIRY